MNNTVGDVNSQLITEAYKPTSGNDTPYEETLGNQQGSESFDNLKLSHQFVIHKMNN